MAGKRGYSRVRAAAVQAGSVIRPAPEWFDLDATVDKAVGLIEKAGKNGARLVVFPEGWLPCFTYWSNDFADPGLFRELWAKFLWNCVEVPSKETDALGAAARRAKAVVVMGINERDKQYQGRMYNSALYISSEGKIVGTHRKICNTVHERLFHTPGEGGDNLKAVFDTEIGKIGGSICGEHEQLLQLYYWITLGMEIHCSLWPGTKAMETTVDVLSRAAALHGRCFGVISCAYFKEKDQPKDFYRNSHFNYPQRFHGGSGIISPHGEYIAGPVFDEETIVYGDLDFAELDRNRYAVNLNGIYSRWDLFSLQVRQEKYAPVVGMTSDPLAGIEARLSRLEQAAKARARRGGDRPVGTAT
ncbi:MAG: nitrilase-related carbon-nitrogen hydrolase [Chloroflexota bacterium]